MVPKHRRKNAAQHRAPLLLFVVATLLAAFGAGMYVEASNVFPSGLIRSAYKTLVVNLDFSFGIGTDTDESVADTDRTNCVDIDRGLQDKFARELGMWTLKCPQRIASTDVAAHRVEFLAGDAMADPVLVKGEVGTFLDHCPAPSGCLAVEYSRSGAVSRAWPFRPEEIVRANIAPESDYPYEHPIGWSPLDVEVFSISPYPNGDLLVVLTIHGSHPSLGGVARVAPDGQPRWYRKDYSHHWGHVVSENLALVPSMRIDRSQIEYEIRIGSGRRSRSLRLECGGNIQEDTVNFVGGEGELLDQISVLDAIAESRYAATLVEWRRDPCHPVHLNFVHVLGADARGADGIVPGDLVISMRNLNAFAILDKDGHRLKKLVRGSFLAQHGVRHLDNARFIMYDNLGTDGVQGPSRLMIVDLATGKETTVFPNDATPSHLLGWFAFQEGQFDISPDGRRALLADVFAGRALEIRLADGQVLNAFRQLHDLSKLPELPDALTEYSWLFRFRGIYYANRWTERSSATPSSFLERQ